MANEKPKRASATLPNSTLVVGCRPSNWLEAMILLSLRSRNSYGYELMSRVRTYGFGAMNNGTLYRMLRRMEEDGVVESSWEISKGGPARRMYALTDSGETRLGVWAKSLERYQQSMDAFFVIYGDTPLHEG